MSFSCTKHHVRELTVLVDAYKQRLVRFCVPPRRRNLDVVDVGQWHVQFAGVTGWILTLAWRSDINTLNNVYLCVLRRRGRQLSDWVRLMWTEVVSRTWQPCLPEPDWLLHPEPPPSGSTTSSPSTEPYANTQIQLKVRSAQCSTRCWSSHKRWKFANKWCYKMVEKYLKRRGSWSINTMHLACTHSWTHMSDSS